MDSARPMKRLSSIYHVKKNIYIYLKIELNFHLSDQCIIKILEIIIIIFYLGPAGQNNGNLKIRIIRI